MDLRLVPGESPPTDLKLTVPGIIAGLLLATEDATDTAAVSGTVASPDATGTLAATEAGDTAAFSGTLASSGTLDATESADTAAFTGTLLSTGALSSTEAADTAEAGGQVQSTQLPPHAGLMVNVNRMMSH